MVNHLYELQPKKSNGLDNYLDLSLKTGETLKVHFFQDPHKQIGRCKELLIQYHKSGILSWLHLIHLLEITRYEEIQVFKKKISQPSTNSGKN